MISLVVCLQMDSGLVSRVCEKFLQNFLYVIYIFVRWEHVKIRSIYDTVGNSKRSKVHKTIKSTSNEFLLSMLG